MKAELEGGVSRRFFGEYPSFDVFFYCQPDQLDNCITQEHSFLSVVINYTIRGESVD